MTKVARIDDTGSPTALAKYALILLAISTPYIFFVLWRICIPLEINGNESWNAYHIAHAFDVRRLYPDPSYMINNYTPLSYYIINLINFPIDNTIVTGRIVSVMSILALSITVYFTSLELQQRKYQAAFFGAIWFFVTMFRGFVGYAGMNDPHLLGLAVMSLGFLHFIKYRNTSYIYLSFSIFIFAGLIKNSLFAFPLTALVILVLEKNERLIKAIIFSLLLVIAICGLFYEIYGENFFSQLLIPREIKFIRIIQSAHRLQWVIIPIIYWAYWLKVNLSTFSGYTTLTMVAIATFIFFITGAAEGVGTNAIFELVYSAAICTSIAINYVSNLHYRKFSQAKFFFLLLALRTVGTLHNDPYYLIFSPTYWDEIQSRVQIVNDEIKTVSEMSDPVTCTLVTVCYLAGREYHADAPLVEQNPNGHWTIKQ